MTTASELETIDPITFTVLRNGFRAMCSQGSALVERVAWGPVITQGRDYSVGLLTGDGRLVGHGTVDITPHMGTFEFSVKAVVEDFGGEMEPGDVFILNDPYRGGTHNQDVRLVRPVFLGDELFAYAVDCGHWSDMGGPIPGTFNPAATESWAEGIGIPPTRLYHRDRPVNGDRAIGAWTESDDAPVGPSGLTPPALSSATYDGTLHCFPHLVPLNHGIFRSLEVKTRPGWATHVLHPTPVAGYCASGSEK